VCSCVLCMWARVTVHKGGLLCALCMKLTAAYRADVLYQTSPKLGKKCERAGRNSLMSLREVGLLPGRFRGNCQ